MALAPANDRWANWVLSQRDGGDRARACATRDAVAAQARRLLALAGLTPGSMLADIGCGEGLLSWEALSMTAGALRVALSDVSPRLLRRARAFARLCGHAARCRFSLADATRLGHLPDSSIDIAALRAVLAYVDDKPAALREAWRVLRPGGRLALAEPVFQDEALAAAELQHALQLGAATDPVLPLLLRWKAAQFPTDAVSMARNAACSCNERDLLRLVRQTGYDRVHLELHIDLQPAPACDWETFIARAPHPLAPSLAEILHQRFDADERVRFERALRPQVESGRLQADDRTVYLVARKPG